MPRIVIQASARKLPRFSWKNNKYLGTLPEEFHDMTLAERQICSLSHAVTHITKIYVSKSTSATEDDIYSTKLHGNVCAFPTNNHRLANHLPNTLADLNNILTVVYIGHRKPKKTNFRYVLRVRKQKVSDYLSYLLTHHKSYKELPDSHVLWERLKELPEDDVPTGLFEQVAESVSNDVRKKLQTKQVD